MGRREKRHSQCALAARQSKQKCFGTVQPVGGRSLLILLIPQFFMGGMLQTTSVPYLFLLLLFFSEPVLGLLCGGVGGVYHSAGECVECLRGSFCPGNDGMFNCTPATACSTPGLASQPPCYWNVSTLAGSGAKGYIDNPGRFAAFNNPHGVLFDPSNQVLYVADFGNHRVRVIDMFSKIVTTLAGGGSGLNGIGTAASFKGPCSLALLQNKIFLADYANHAIRTIDLSSKLVNTVIGDGSAGNNNGIGTLATLDGPVHVSFDSSGSTGYVVEQAGSRIRAFSVSSLAVTTLAGSGIQGFNDAIGTLAQFSGPSSAIWHPSGFLFVGDGSGTNHRVRRINLLTKQVTTLSGNGGAGGTDGIGTNAKHSDPRGLGLNADATVLYVADDSGSRIRSVNLSSALVRSIAGNGIAGHRDGFGVSAVFNKSLYLSVSPSGVI